MQLRAEQLARQLQQQLAPVYLLSGDEPFLIQEAADSIRATAREQQYSERLILHVDSGFSWQELLDSASNLSLFAEQRIIELRLRSSKIGDQGSKAIQHYCGHCLQDNLLMITAPRLDKASQNAKWVKAIDQVGTLVQFWPVPAGELPRWLQARLAAQGLSADQEALQTIAELVEGNLLAAAQEVDKLALLSPDGRITAAMVSEAVGNSSRYTVYNLIDLALAGDARGALRVLSGLQSESNDAGLISWALSREIHALDQARCMQSQGQSSDNISRSLKIFGARKALFQRALKRLPESAIRHLLALSIRIDHACKGLDDSAPWPLIRECLLNLTGISLKPGSRSQKSA